MERNKKRVETPVKKASGTQIVRVKRCHLCRKTFVSDRFEAHFNNCYRFDREKLQPERNNQNTVRPNRMRNVSEAPQSHHENKNEQRKFRITNRIRQDSKSGTFARNKAETVAKNKGQAKKLIKKEQQSKVEQKVKDKVNPEESGERVLTDENVEEEKESQQQLRQSNETQNMRRVQVDINEHEERNQVQRPIMQESSDILQRQREQNRNLSQQSQINQEQPNVNHAQRTDNSYSMTELIANSNSIIRFIEDLNANDEVLETMLAQLRQLNSLSHQINELNEHSHRLGFEMNHLFGRRIHEAQTLMLNQIGIAVLRAFERRMTPQIERLLQRTPNLKPGFMKQEIENMFPEKVFVGEGQCAICLQALSTGIRFRELQCRHPFHPSCIDNWLISSKKCPMCRSIQQQDTL